MTDTPERIDIWAQSLCRELRQETHLVPYTVMMKAIQTVGIAPPSPAAVAVDREAIMELIRANISTFDDVGVEESADAILSAITPAVAGWRDMDSAPKDGRAVLLWWPHWWHDAHPGYYLHNQWHSDKAMIGGTDDDPNGPQAWTPLPPAPGQPATEGPEAVQEKMQVGVLAECLSSFLSHTDGWDEHQLRKRWGNDYVNNVLKSRAALRALEGGES